MAAEHKAFSAPDEVRELPLGEAEIVQIGGGEGRPLHAATRLALTP